MNSFVKRNPALIVATFGLMLTVIGWLSTKGIEDYTSAIKDNTRASIDLSSTTRELSVKIGYIANEMEEQKMVNGAQWDALRKHDGTLIEHDKRLDDGGL